MSTETPRRALGDGGIVVVLRAMTPDRLRALVDVLSHAGIGGFEVTFDHPDAVELAVDLRRAHPDRLIGVGTVTAPGQLEAAASAGFDFAVSPHLDPALVSAAQVAGLPYLPGVMTPSDVAAAAALGLDLVKLFPAGPLGPGYLRALRGPFPAMRFMPSGGIRLDTVGAFLDAGAAAVSLGGELAAPAGPLDEVAAAARAYVAAVAGRTAGAR